MKLGVYNSWSTSCAHAPPRLDSLVPQTALRLSLLELGQIKTSTNKQRDRLAETRYMLGERGGICLTLVDGSAMRCLAVVSVCRVSGRV